jgi:hypothetical protein
MRVEARTTTSSLGSYASNTQTGNRSRRDEIATENACGTNSRPGGFQSVLTKPFRLWNNIEDLVAEFLPEWSPGERSYVIKNLLRFLELKVIMDEYEPNKLLAPTQLVAHAWHVLILETKLYRDVAFTIQDFHARPRRMIHHGLMSKSEKNGYEERLDRTQSLFMSYYQSEMPRELTEIDGGGSRISALGKVGTKKRRKGVSSIVSALDEAPSYQNKSARKSRGTEKNQPKLNLWMPTCGCLMVTVGDEFCSRRDVTNDIFAIKDDVSQLTQPDSVIAELVR